MDTQTVSGVTYTMDAAERYPLSMARDLLSRQLGRKTAAKTLVDARFGGPVTIGGTRVAWRGDGFTITDA